MFGEQKRVIGNSEYYKIAGKKSTKRLGRKIKEISQSKKKLVNRRDRKRKLKNHPRRSNIQIMGVSRQKEL